ncbi:sodium/glutamate symporter [Achromobacter sp. AONIH1]|uniref:sodium/glutamate symporter n=1 Tax=Achromobacter sp. AONIH1 TaxID=1758194 RepID=UPI000CD0F745|nr:sodium/glutamate symporter [Achromobacter sp. AONIH1]AUT45999.1 sodium/glutamate symporter [Achromobacter sp. AONIH1]
MISLTPVQSLLACCLVLVIGRVLTSRIGVLARYSIPDPIVGGLLFAIAAYLLSNWGGVSVSLDTSIRPTLLLLFFGCIGLTANLKLLAKGGPRLIAFLLALIPFLVLQNAVGLGMAWLLDMHPLMGLLGGTITLVGGHGTGAAYATRFADFNNIQDVMALAMTSATLGLVLGGVVGGPVAEWLMRRHKLAGSLDQATASHDAPDLSEDQAPSTSGSFIVSLTAAFICLALGGYLATLVENAPVSLPNFLWCLATGVLIRNGGARLGLKLDDRATEIIGTVALSLFLGMTMMTLDLSSVARLAGPLALMLAVQTLFCALYASLVMFRALKRDYEASIMSAAFCGFALGATATAIANMQALTRRHGPAPEAFIVVPVTGAFLVDILNVIVLTSLISLPFVGGM